MYGRRRSSAALRRVATALVAGAALAAGSAAGAADGPSLHFLGPGVDRRVDLAEMQQRCTARVVTVDDPYYGSGKRFRAVPLPCVLRLGFGEDLAGLPDDDVLLRAADGYARDASGAQLLEAGGFLAFADADLEEGGGKGFAPIDRRQVDPGPFYLVWQGEGRSDSVTWPWPYQLVEVERLDFRERYPHTVPAGLPDTDPAWRGYALFRRSCSACHAINGEGGSVGPDLNVPRSIVDYRPEAQIRAFIRDPRSFRYTSMPAHPGLDDADLDALVAYLRAMSQRKHDPGPPAGH